MKVKLNSTFHVFAFFMAVLTFSLPFVAVAQQNSVEGQAVIDAAADANKDVNIPLWFGTGCLISGLVFLPLPGWYSGLLPPAGLAGTYFYQPSPPAARFVGKSVEYINVYSETYKKERGKLQALWSTAGCVSGGVVVTGCTVVGLISLGIGTAIGVSNLE